MTGFWIKKVSALSDNKPEAFIELKRGTNVISGPSDTGKSYIFSIINFVLGRSKPPKDIVEGIGYDRFTLEIVTHASDSKFMLTRKLGKNVVQVKNIKTNEVEDYKTKARLDSESHISTFLLKLCKLEGTILLKNKTKGQKINLSFKNLIQLTSISDERIITESSPFYFSNIPSNRMMEQSLLSAILEGNDFSNVSSIEDPKKKETRISGKLEFIDQQIINYTEERIEVESLIKAKPEGWAFDIEDINIKLNEKINEGKRIESEIEENIKHISDLTEKRIYNRELNTRFKILKRQYQSDLNRLIFILEAESLTEQLPSHLCPICSSPIELDQIKHLKEIDNFKSSVLAESEIINKKLSDLAFTLENTEEEFAQIQLNYQKISESLNQRKQQLQEINPEIVYLKNTIANLITSEKLNNRIEFIDTLIEKLYADKDNLNKAKDEREKTDVVNICDYELLGNLSRFIEKRLKSWNFDNNPKVIFNSETFIFDIIISGKSRGSYGSGRRAISYSACLIGILDYCLSRNRSFHNFILLDSPLTTFRKAVKNGTESKLLDLESLFFNDLKNISQSSQIIIVDTKVPQNVPGLNLISFTKNEDIGRYGFIPLKDRTKDII